MRRSGALTKEMRGTTGPFVAGMEFAGVLEEVGPSTDTELKIGDDVMGVVMPCGTRGAYSQQLTVASALVVRMPRNADYVSASTLPMNGLTALITLDALNLDAEQSLAVTGAPGAYGGYVVQLAKVAGLRVIADAGPTDHALVKQLGADLVLDRGDDVGERIRLDVPGGVHALVDGALLNEKIAVAVCDGGSIATLRGYVGAEERGIVWHPVNVRHHLTDPTKLDYLHGHLEYLSGLADQRHLQLRVAAVLPGDQAAEAHRRLEAGGTRGRLVLAF
jgi:NADPH:quinone reductase-like Zn-dependent oxidoreductase